MTDLDQHLGACEHGDFRDQCRICQNGAPPVSANLQELTGLTNHDNHPPRHKSLPTLDPAAYHGPIGDYVRAIAPGTESDPVAVLIQSHAWAGARIGRSVHLRHGASTNYPQIWPLIVGRTATGRKGTSETESLNSLSSLSSPPRRRSGLSSGEGLIEAFMPDTPGDPPPDPRLLVTETEWESVLARARKEGSSLSPVIRNSYDNQPLSTMTTSSRLVENYSLTIVGHITPPAFREGMTGKDLSNGFLNRFLVVSAHRPQLIPWPDVPSDESKRLLNEIIKRSSSVDLTGEMSIDTPARNVYTHWYERSEQGKEAASERVAMANGRTSTNLLRLAQIYAYLDRTLTIGEPHLLGALALVDYSAACIDSLLAAGKAGLDGQILEVLKTKGQMTRTQISDNFNRHKSAEEITAALTVLVDSHLVDWWSEPTEGAPRTVFSVSAK